jgi:hypothetical protein
VREAKFQRGNRQSGEVEMTGKKLSRMHEIRTPLVMATIGLLVAVAAAWATQDSKPKGSLTSSPGAYAAGAR